jgi:protein-L-isoaspartate O-methyltransferase
VIVVTAPPSLKQLKPGGRMVLPVGTRFTTQQLVLVRKLEDGRITHDRCCPSPSCRSPADMTDGVVEQRPPLASTTPSGLP